MNNVPVPHDISLELPMPAGILKILLVILFLLHILFVNFMVGGITLAMIFEFVGLERKKYDALARELSKTVTVNKSLAVVLGVAPLLAINLAYTNYFYAATSLTGFAWAMLIPLVTVAFLLTYLHSYTWSRWTGELKILHIIAGLSGMLLFWFIPFIFLANVNLMLFPSRWAEVQGFLSALALPNVIPRYLHFILATLAVTGLFGAGWFSRKKYPVEQKLPGFSRERLKYIFFMVAFVITCLQFIIGPINLLSLPVHGMSFRVWGWFTLGLGSAILFMLIVWREIRLRNALLGVNFWTVIVLLTTTVVSMAFGRHSYREQAIDSHRQLIAEKTDAFYWKSQAAQARARMGVTKTTYSSVGEQAFEKNCSVCHTSGAMLVGPSLEEIYDIYESNPQGIVDWSKAPGVKRGGAAMPAFNHLGDDVLMDIAGYMLDAVATNDAAE